LGAQGRARVTITDLTMGTGSVSVSLLLVEVILDMVRSLIWFNMALFSSMIVGVVDDCLLAKYPRTRVGLFCYCKEFR